MCLSYAVEWHHSFDGTVFCVWTTGQGRSGLNAYRLTKLTSSIAEFDKIGEFNPSFLEKYSSNLGYWGGWNWEDQLQNGLFYTVEGGRNTVVNSAISVFDTRGKQPMRRVGHFAAPGASIVQPLADGRAIVGGGNKLWLIGPPPRR
jgi:hypothetical protein